MKTPLVKTSAIAASFLLWPFYAAAQTSMPGASPTQPQDNQTVPVLRTTVKNVVIDVVVRDQNGRPVHGLKASDFSLFENDRLQQLQSFSEHAGVEQRGPEKPQPRLAPGLFTNFVSAPSTGPADVLVIDTLNTPLADQMYARRQLLDFLKKSPEHTQLAIFGLSRSLVMLQGFTTDHSLLRAALERHPGRGSTLLDAPNGVGSQTGTADTGLEENDPATAEEISAAVDQFETQQQTFQYQLRIQYTLDALNQLAHYLSNIPGRKNMIWFSGSFPLSMTPTSNGINGFDDSISSEAEYKETVDLLTLSRVSIYPIDVRGLQTNPNFSAANSGRTYASDPQAASRDVARLALETAQENGTMLALAGDTGGRAYLNTNGLSDAVADAIADGSDFYTLVYSPLDKDGDGKFRSIRVQLQPHGYSLTYRKGYFAESPDAAHGATSRDRQVNAAPPGSESVLQRAMMRGAPNFTDVQFTIRARPTSGKQEDAPSSKEDVKDLASVKGPYEKISVDYAVNPRSFVFTQENGTFRDSVDFIVYLLDMNGNLINSVSQTLHADFQPNVYASFIQTPFSFNQELSVPIRGTYFLRVAVRDANSSKIGTLEVPVAAIRQLKPLEASPE